MNLVRLFTREEPIAGLEISDSFLRLAFLEFDKKVKTKTPVKFLTEEELPDGVIVNGIIENKAAFIKSLQNLLKKSGAGIRYVIASLPADNIYARLFYLPRVLTGEKLEEAMQLTVGFQLPVKPEEVYLDWERVEDTEQNEIFLGAAPKQIINDYVDALTTAKLGAVAVEFHPLSFLRVMDLPEKETALIKVTGKTDTEVFIVKDKVLRFVRVLPLEKFTKKKLEEEIRKIKDFYEAETGPISRLVDLGEAKIIEKFGDHPEIRKDPSRWLISLGAAARGLIPRVEDTLISLLPVGTETAYEYQKAVTFTHFASNLTVGLAVFFSAAFVGVWFLMASVIGPRTTTQLENFASLPVPPDAEQLENRAKKLNALVRGTGEIAKMSPRWSDVLEELKNQTPSGLILGSLSLPAPEATLTASGLAPNRPLLNLFKKNLTDSPLFTSVAAPLTNIEQKENIPFTVTFRLKQPGLLYD